MNKFKTPIYKFKVKVYIHAGRGVWYMITLPVDVAQEIDVLFSDQKRGWGSLSVEATAGKTTWQTSIFPSKERNSYIMLLKKEVRKNEDIKKGDDIIFKLQVRN